MTQLTSLSVFLLVRESLPHYPQHVVSGELGTHVTSPRIFSSQSLVQFPLQDGDLLVQSSDEVDQLFILIAQSLESVVVLRSSRSFSLLE